MPESDLIHDARQGDLEAFNRLVLQYQDQVYRQSYWMLGDPQAADDICQETFLRAFQKLRSFRDGSFRGWLLRIAQRLCLDELRRRKRRQILPLELPDAEGNEYSLVDWQAEQRESPEELAEGASILRLIHQSLENLNPEYRSVITLVDLQGYDYTQASEVLAIPLGTVKSRLARARFQVRGALLASGALEDRLPGKQKSAADLCYGIT
jgi:RNA polymerase sigma-70 factor (ECF subfamily)